MSTPEPEHIEMVHHVTTEQTLSGPLHHCIVCKATTYFQAAPLPCPGPPVYLTSTDPAVHAAMLDALTRHGVLTEQHGYMPIDETGAHWAIRSLDEALEVAAFTPVGDTYGDGAPRPGIVSIEHGIRHQSEWRMVGEVTL